MFGNHDYTHYNMSAALPRMWRTFADEDAVRCAAANPLQRAYLKATRWLRYVQYVRNTPLDGLRIGSNDTDALTALLTRRGMRVLHNQVVHLQQPEHGLDLYLAGIDDVYEGRPRLGETLDCVPQGATVVLLSHNPDIIASPRLSRIDLVIGGPYARRTASAAAVGAGAHTVRLSHAAATWPVTSGMAARSSTSRVGWAKAFRCVSTPSRRSRC